MNLDPFIQNPAIWGAQPANFTSQVTVSLVSRAPISPISAKQERERERERDVNILDIYVYIYIRTEQSRYS